MTAELVEVATKAANRYARRVWWADSVDLKQEAMVAALRAARTWDPTVGVRLEAYAWRACILHLRAYLWRQSSPVSETDHRLSTLRGVHRTPLDAPVKGGRTVADVLRSRTQLPEEAFADAEWRAEVRRQVREVVAECVDEHKDLVVQLVLGTASHEELAAAAAERGLSRQDMHRLTQAARSAIRADLVLYRLLQEKL